jgi:hypothetical protein
MSSRSANDLDLINDLTGPGQDDLSDRPNSYPTAWSGFWGGILIGIAGGALVPLAPWLGGALIFAGYGMTAFALAKSPNRFARALRFGFGTSAIVGGATLAGAALFPETTGSLIATLGERHLIFRGVVTMPWALTLIKFTYGLFR